MTDTSVAPPDRVAPAADWGIDGLRTDLGPLLPGLSIEVAPCLPSTNSVLLERARDAAARWGDAAVQVRRSIESRAFGRRDTSAPPCLLVAEHQTAGRGRQGRRWESTAGASLTFSLSLALAAHDWSGLSLAVGVALAEALDPSGAAAARIGLKWPNDLWLLEMAPAPEAPLGRKLGGILIESIASAGTPRVAVIGIGLNLVRFEAAAVSTGLAALHELEPGIDGPTALRRVTRPLAEALRRFERDGLAPFLPAYARRDVLRDRPLATTLAATPEGIGRGVDPDGALRVETPDGIVRIASGEVSVRPSANRATGVPAC